MDLQPIIVTAHAVSTVMMTGLIWFVQLVHYPLMHQVGEAGFSVYENEHTRRTTWIVAPMMLVELVSALLLLIYVDGGDATILARIGFVLVVLNWISTAFIQVPCHKKLIEGFDAAAVEKLVATNWIRTVAWTLRTIIAIAIWFVV